MTLETFVFKSVFKKMKPNLIQVKYSYIYGKKKNNNQTENQTSPHTFYLPERQTDVNK